MGKPMIPQGMVSLRAVILLLLLAGLVYVGFQFGEALILHATLERDVEEMARRDILNRRGDLHGKLINRMSKIRGSFVPDQDLAIKYSPSRDAVQVEIYYARDVQLKVATVPLEMHVDVTVEESQAKSKIDSVREAFDTMGQSTGSRYKKSVKEAFDK